MLFSQVLSLEQMMGSGSSVQPSDPMASEKGVSLGQQLSTAIKHQDITTLDSLLGKMTVLEKETHLNPTFLKKKSLWMYRHSKDSLFQDPPLLFQALLQGQQTFDALLRAGANLFLADPQGWNIIHYLITVSHHIPDMEDTCVKIYETLKAQLVAEEMSILLKMEDHEKLRPLEFAVNLACIKMFNAILNTEHVYLVSTETKGFYNIKEYDVTDYETFRCKNRRDRSPLLLLSLVDRKVLRDDTAVQIITKGLLQKWTRAKLICSAPFVVIWAALRLFCMFCFYLILGTDISGEVFAVVFDEGVNLKEYLDNVTQHLANSTNVTCDITDWYGAYEDPEGFIAALAYVLLYCTFSVSGDIIEGLLSLCKNWNRWKMCFGKKKDLITSALYYRMCQLIFSLTALTWFILYIFLPGQVFVMLGLIIVTYVSTWSALFFIQIISHTGHFVNSIQRMLTVMLQFIFVYAIILIPFPHAFQVMLRSPDVCDKVENFDSLGQGMYSSIRIMLNMIDFTAYKNAPSVGVAYVLHVFFVFMVAILLVNFLIALMSASVGEVVDSGEAIMLVQRLSVVLLVEWRVLYPFVCVYMLLHKICFKTNRGRITLTHVEKVTSL